MDYDLQAHQLSEQVNALTTERDRLRRALEDLLQVVNVRIDDPRIEQFDKARAVLASLEEP